MSHKIRKRMLGENQGRKGNRVPITPLLWISVSECVCVCLHTKAINVEVLVDDDIEQRISRRALHCDLLSISVDEVHRHLIVWPEGKTSINNKWCTHQRELLYCPLVAKIYYYTFSKVNYIIISSVLLRFVWTRYECNKMIPWPVFVRLQWNQRNKILLASREKNKTNTVVSKRAHFCCFSQMSSLQCITKSIYKKQNHHIYLKLHLTPICDCSFIKKKDNFSWCEWHF